MSASKPARRPADDLDPADRTDRQILRRQLAVARQAGREGRDRAKSTRGRADLQRAYDEGAQQRTGDEEDQGEEEDPAAAPTAPSRGRRAARQAGRAWKGSTGYVSRGSWQPRMPTNPPSRIRDAGGLATGMLLYTAVVVYLRYGPAGWKGWLRAKFLNQPMSSSAAASAAAGGSGVQQA